MHKINIKNLLKDKRVFSGIGGITNKYILLNSQIILASDIGWYYYTIANLHIGDSYTPQGIECPKTHSYIGMDIINQFKLSTDNNTAFLFK